MYSEEFGWPLCGRLLENLRISGMIVFLLFMSGLLEPAEFMLIRYLMLGPWVVSGWGPFRPEKPNHVIKRLVLSQVTSVQPCGRGGGLAIEVSSGQ